MSGSATQLTIATSSGLAWLALVLHFGAGLIALVAGFIAIAATKGGRAHRQAGMVFVVAMITTGLVAVGIAVYEGKPTSAVGGTFTAYLVVTALTTVRPLVSRNTRSWNVALMLLAFTVALSNFFYGFIALGRPRATLDGVPAPMIFFMGTIALLAAIGDWRLIRAGDIRGARRVARHLWRMCFGLFIASGSFFLGQMKFLPPSLRIVSLITTLAVAPLVVLLYWMWRVRLKQRLRGMVIRTPVQAG